MYKSIGHFNCEAILHCVKFEIKLLILHNIDSSRGIQSYEPHYIYFQTKKITIPSLRINPGKLLLKNKGLCTRKQH